jgi:RNA polymerase sigma factor (sigma-70 family)
MSGGVTMDPRMEDHGSVTDAELLEAWHRGDGRAGDELFRRHFGAVFRFFRAKLDDGIEDLVHQTFVRCLASAPRYRAIGSVRSFLIGIGRHVLYDGLRKKRRERRALELNFMSIDHIVGSPSIELRVRDRHDALLVALRKLPLDLQIILELSYWEELPTIEMAHVLEIPIGTVKSRLFRARKLLRQIVEELEVPEPVRAGALDRLDDTAVELGNSMVDASRRSDP